MTNFDGKGLQSRSLDQLKRIDSSPSVQDQLQTASALCTTPERASMILRWLLEKLKIAQDFLTSSETWKLFVSALRLVPPQRAVNHLGSQNLVDLFRAATLECLKTGSVLTEINEALRVVLAISRSAQGANFRAVLRCPSDKAAAFTGVWLEACVSSGAYGNLSLSPALEIWGIRKPGTNDDDLFSTNCLPWAARLLVGSSAHHQNEIKRGNDGNPPIAEDLADIRRLIAKHALLPSRIMFFAEAGTDGLRMKLQALSTNNVDLGTLPRLFGIAASLVPVTTPKQRREESLWVEAVFRCMTALISNLSGNKDQARHICDLLDVVLASTYSLSQDMLSDIVAEFTMLLESDSSEVHWSIIGRLVQSDPSLFLEEPFSSAMFERLPSCLAEEGDLDEPRISAYTIALSVMQCFATYHRLPDYFSHLEREAKRDPRTMWAQLSFDDALDALPTPLIIAQIDRYAAWLKPGAPVHEILASIPLLLNLLNTRFNDETWLQLYQQCGIIFKSSLGLVNSEFKAAGSRLWSLARIAFELWFPLWVHEQSEDMSPFMEMGVTMLSTKKLWEAAETDEDALTFLTTVCLAFRPYPGCARFYDDLVAKLRSDGRPGLASAAVPAFVPYPELLTDMLNVGQQDSLIEILGSISADHGVTVIDHLVAQLQTGNERQRQAARYAIAKVAPSSVGKGQKRIIDRCDEKWQALTRPKVLTHPENDHLQASETLLEVPPPVERQAILEAFKSRISHTGREEKVRAIEDLLSLAPKAPSGAIPLLLGTISTFENQSVEELDPENKRFDLFDRILCLVDIASNYTQYRYAADCVIYILRDARFMVNQYGVETTLATCHNNLRQASDSVLHLVVLDVCKIFTALIQRHEHKLQGRYHVITLFLQELLTAALQPCGLGAASTDSEATKLKLQRAVAVAQCIKYFCNPRRRVHSKATSPNLSDEALKAKAQIGELARQILHHYCAEVLKHPPNDEVRKALTPALWAMIEAIAMSGERAMESVSAAMNNNQRGILRSVHEDYKTFGKWMPGANDE